MACVVCGNPVGDVHYANAWEKARKLFPCCSPVCASSFDPDLNWMPAKMPRTVDETDERRLLAVSRKRLRDGDRPSVVIREMLVAGVSVTGLRKLVFEAEATRIKPHPALAVFAVLTGRIRIKRDKRDPVLLRDASADLDAWRARFFP